MDSILSAIITAIATLFAVWLNSTLTKKKKIRSIENVENLIEQKKVKKITIFLEEDEEFKSISEASSNRKLKLCKGKIAMEVEFSEIEDLNIKNMNTIKDFNETVRGKMQCL